MDKKILKSYFVIVIGIIFVVIAAVILFRYPVETLRNEETAGRNIAGVALEEGIETEGDTAPTVSVSQNQVDSALQEEPDDMELEIWLHSWQEDIFIKYLELHPECPYRFKFVQPYNFEMEIPIDKLIVEGLSGKIDGLIDIEAPDIFVIDILHAQKFIKGEYSQYVATYEDLGIDVEAKIQEADIPKYMVEMGTNSEGKLVALGYESTSSVFIYRRSIAKEVWGTDDPSVIGDKIGPGWEKFFNAANELKKKGYATVSSIGDLLLPVMDSADMGWVVDGKLQIDPRREEFLDIAKEIVDNGYSNNTNTWHDEWFMDMSGEGERPVFGFMGPPWLINTVMAGNSGDTFGDWAICLPPVGFSWGEIAVFANKDSKYKEFVGDLLEWMTLDSTEKGLQYLLATGTLYPDDPMKVPVSSRNVMRLVDGSIVFLSGQNAYEILMPASDLVKGTSYTQYDELINRYWYEQVTEYANGNKTRGQAIDYFEKYIQYNYHFIVN